jgi:hypothetical protein
MKYIGALCLAAALSISASASTIAYDNTGETSEGRDPAAGSNPLAAPYGPLYNQFLAPANGTTGYYTLSSLSLVMQNCDNSAGGDVDCQVPGGSGVTIGLFADSGNTPGALLTTLGTAFDSSLTSSPALYNISLSPAAQAFEFADTTEYWIGVTAIDGNTTASWNWDGTDSGTGVLGQNEANAAAGTFSVSSFPGTYQMQVQLTDAAAPDNSTPEPVTTLLLGSGALLIGVYHRKRKA